MVLTTCCLWQIWCALSNEGVMWGETSPTECSMSEATTIRRIKAATRTASLLLPKSNA